MSEKERECWCGNKIEKKYSQHYFVCENCHTLISDVDFTEKILHVKDEEKDLYGKNYWEEMMCRLSGKKNLDEIIDYYLQERTLYWIQYALKYRLPKAKVAEIGAGLGQMLYLMKQVGYQEIGFELSKEICEYNKKNLGVNMYQGDIGETDNKFDFIMAFDLLEHIIEPEEFLKRCTNHLAASGIICIQTPCYNEKWSYDEMLEKAPRFKNLLTEFQHIHLFSRSSMEKLLREQGFEYINFEPAVFGDDYDMFVFASKTPMKQNTEEEIDTYLNSIPTGRMIKSMISLYTQVNEKQKVIDELVAYKNYLENKEVKNNSVVKKFLSKLGL